MIEMYEYLNALKVVDKYHKQQKHIIDKGKTILQEWLWDVDLEVRTLNCLRHGRHSFLYLEDVTKDEFLKIRNAGLRSWDDFEEVRNK